jgi:thymidylate synthase (FAD)
MNSKQIDPAELRAKLGGKFGEEDTPHFQQLPEFTVAGAAYFKNPGVSLMGRTAFFRGGLEPFLEGFPKDLEFQDYLIDDEMPEEDGTELIKTFGQLCYMSFGPKRSWNKDAQSYMDNLKKSGHGSVLEHPVYNFLIWGGDRSFTHELVRHRAGAAFSQVSQRYVDGKCLRFVERPEYQNDDHLHEMFVRRIDLATVEYNNLAAYLANLQSSGEYQFLQGEKKTELRKKVNQCARSALPNETEAPIALSLNGRALRHVCEMRANGAADVPIRQITTRLFLIGQFLEPKLFSDYKLLEFEDGTHCVTTDWRKV